MSIAAEGKTHTATGGYLFKTVGGKTRYLHIAAAERAIGKPLPVGAEIHHINGNPSDNRNSNLVICPNHAYHSLLHQRQMAQDITGNANLRLCRFCQIYDNPGRMTPQKNQFYHKKCLAFYSKKRRALIKTKSGETL